MHRIVELNGREKKIESRSSVDTAQMWLASNSQSWSSFLPLLWWLLLLGRLHGFHHGVVETLRLWESWYSGSFWVVIWRPQGIVTVATSGWKTQFQVWVRLDQFPDLRSEKKNTFAWNFNHLRWKIAMFHAALPWNKVSYTTIQKKTQMDDLVWTGSCLQTIPATFGWKTSVNLMKPCYVKVQVSPCMNQIPHKI